MEFLLLGPYPSGFSKDLKRSYTKGKQLAENYKVVSSFTLWDGDWVYYIWPIIMAPGDWQERRTLSDNEKLPCIYWRYKVHVVCCVMISPTKASTYIISASLHFQRKKMALYTHFKNRRSTCFIFPFIRIYTALSIMLLTVASIFHVHVYKHVGHLGLRRDWRDSAPNFFRRIWAITPTDFVWRVMYANIQFNLWTESGCCITSNIGMRSSHRTKQFIIGLLISTLSGAVHADQ